MLFLDANIFLDFYRFGNDDIVEMGKLVSLIKDKEVEVIKNDHLVDEIQRLREATLASSFSELRATKYSIRAPNYCERMPEYSELKDILKDVNKAHAKLLSEAESMIAQRKLPADELIREILKGARNISITEEIYSRALRRRDVNNPPGKRGEIGDAIHWEALLADDDVWSIDIVSNDGDFESELDPGTVKSFLKDEWSRKGTRRLRRIELFKSLTDYFKKRYPKIKLSDETAKRSLIQQLQSSPNFASTHAIIADLTKYSYFTQSQIDKLFYALVENNQVNWIADDDDIREFFLGFKDDAWLIPDELHEDAARILGVQDDFFLPF